MSANARKTKKKVIDSPVRPVLQKIKFTQQQMHSAIQLSLTEEEKMAIGKVAALESELRKKREVGLQEAFTPPTAAQQVPVKGLPSHGHMECQPAHHSAVGEEEGDIEEGDILTEGTPLFLSDEVDDQFSPQRRVQDTPRTEPEWTGFSDNEVMPVCEDDSVSEADKPSPKIMKSATQEKPKAKSKKPLMVRDLVRSQIRADSQLNTLGSKKRKLTSDGDRPMAKRVVSKSSNESTGNGLTIRPGFLEDDDRDTVECDRKAVLVQKGKSKSIVKVTHEKAPPTAEEKRKRSNIANCYLKDFNTKFVPELIRHVSDDTNPWQPTFDADSVIKKIRQQVYPNIAERFNGQDPLFAPAFTRVTNWRAAIGRRAIGIVKTYFGDKGTFEKTEEIEEHVRWLLPDKDEENEDSDEEDEEEDGIDVDIEEVVRRRKRKFVGAPFLYENGLIGPAEEPPSGYLLSPLVLKTFAIHFESTGINADPIACERQVGALALTLAAVERAVSCWDTGEEKKPLKAFSQVEYGAMTQEYVEALLQVPGGHWELILASTRQYTPWKQDVLKKKEKKSSTRARIPTGL